MTRMLVSVVDNALVGGVDKMEHYSVAAKTGTAQLVEKGKKVTPKESSTILFSAMLRPMTPNS